jgi:hypothetical protein
MTLAYLTDLAAVMIALLGGAIAASHKPTIVSSLSRQSGNGAGGNGTAASRFGKRSGVVLLRTRHIAY